MKKACCSKATVHPRLPTFPPRRAKCFFFFVCRWCARSRDAMRTPTRVTATSERSCCEKLANPVVVPPILQIMGLPVPPSLFRQSQPVLVAWMHSVLVREVAAATNSLTASGTFLQHDRKFLQLQQFKYIWNPFKKESTEGYSA